MESELITVWRGSDDDFRPVEMKCKEFGWPNLTECGDKMFDNCHFRTEAEAWESIKRSVNAHLSMVGRNVKEQKRRLRQAQVAAGRAVERFARFREGYEDWQREQVQHEFIRST